MVALDQHKTALYTTFYPGVEKFLHPWVSSVADQSDGSFDVWIGLDEISREQATIWLGNRIQANWIDPIAGASPALIRDRAFRILTENYEFIVLVDADDVLENTRIEAARRALHEQEVAGCALRIIDETGRELNHVFTPSKTSNCERLLPRHNVFGLSNTAYRASTLRKCLPIPAECVLIDWLLATRAWCLGAAMTFDATPHMLYRQYASNTAGVLTPFSASQILVSTKRVLQHYRCLLGSDWVVPERQRREIATAQERADIFYQSISGSETLLQEYVEALNRLEPEYVWWWSVAHRELETIWNK